MRSWKKGFSEGRESVQAERTRREEEQKRKYETAEPSPIARKAGAFYERAAPYIQGAKKSYKQYKKSSAKRRSPGPRRDPWAGLNRLSDQGNQGRNTYPTARQGGKKGKRRDPYDMSHLENMFK